MDAFLDLFVVAIILALLNVAQLIVNQLDRKRADNRERLLLKAILSNNVQEFSYAEENPQERLRREELENELAEKAAELEKEREDRMKDVGIPIT